MEQTEIVMNTNPNAPPTPSVAVIKLVSGEELIGILVADSEKSVTLNKLLGIAVEFDEQTRKMGFGFLPFSPLTNPKKTFQYDRLVYVTEPNDTLKEAYLTATGEKRIIAPKQGLIVE